MGKFAQFFSAKMPFSGNNNVKRYLLGEDEAIYAKRSSRDVSSAFNTLTTCVCAGAVLVAKDKERRSQELKF